MSKDILFSMWYDSLEGTKSQGFAYKAWCAGWEAALAQPEQGCAECGVKTSDGYALYCVKCTELFTQPEQEPVAWIKVWDEKEKKHILMNYYPAPPSKPWVSLTDEEVKSILDCGRGGLVDIKKTEQLLKERNT